MAAALASTVSLFSMPESTRPKRTIRLSNALKESLESAHNDARPSLVIAPRRVGEESISSCSSRAPSRAPSPSGRATKRRKSSTSSSRSSSIKTRRKSTSKTQLESEEARVVEKTPTPAAEPVVPPAPSKPPTIKLKLNMTPPKAKSPTTTPPPPPTGPALKLRLITSVPKEPPANTITPPATATPLERVASSGPAPATVSDLSPEVIMKLNQLKKPATPPTPTPTPPTLRSPSPCPPQPTETEPSTPPEATPTPPPKPQTAAQKAHNTRWDAAAETLSALEAREAAHFTKNLTNHPSVSPTSRASGFDSLSTYATLRRAEHSRRREAEATRIAELEAWHASQPHPTVSSEVEVEQALKRRGRWGEQGWANGGPLWFLADAGKAGWDGMSALAAARKRKDKDGEEERQEKGKRRKTSR